MHIVLYYVLIMSLYFICYHDSAPSHSSNHSVNFFFPVDGARLLPSCIRMISQRNVMAVTVPKLCWQHAPIAIKKTQQILSLKVLGMCAFPFNSSPICIHLFPQLVIRSHMYHFMHLEHLYMKF